MKWIFISVWWKLEIAVWTSIRWKSRWVCSSRVSTLRIAHWYRNTGKITQFCLSNGWILTVRCRVKQSVLGIRDPRRIRYKNQTSPRELRLSIRAVDPTVQLTKFSRFPTPKIPRRTLLKEVKMQKRLWSDRPTLTLNSSLPLKKIPAGPIFKHTLIEKIEWEVPVQFSPFAIDLLVISLHSSSMWWT